MITHCGTCGNKHEEEEFCSPGAFVVLFCKKCGEESLMPADAMFGIGGLVCGQCDDNNGDHWGTRNANLDDMKKHWKGYGDKNEERRST